ncbi:MAG: crossover junction endodeoxyribonuclease RuvC [Acidimicrobiia bacterium]|nr:crossover junction endodeoxyribonuclease RuvC [Acidimicrobiia bacterium]
MFVLGIDPGLSVTGYGLLRSGYPPMGVAAGVIRTDPDMTMTERLVELAEGLRQVLGDHQPDSVAIETVFTNRNRRTAMSVVRASGVAMLVAGEAGLPVTEYPPTQVKLAVAGDGAAGKREVMEMVSRILRLSEPPRPADVTDALAVALCHLRAAPLTGAISASPAGGAGR